MAKNWALALHGGAGPLRNLDHARAERHMAGLLREGETRLARGEAALEVVHRLVEALEACGLHIAGKGSSPNAIGQWELGAAAIAREHKLERVHSPKQYYTPVITRPVKKGELAHGTVGAVALDQHGRLAAATSTGGLLGKTPGRVGDTPIIGAGLWADERVAVCCTGQGEYFLRTNAAADVSSRVRYARQGLSEAISGSLEDLNLLGGDGGMIGIDVLGHVEVVFNAETMKRGVVTSAGRFEVATMR